MMSLSPKFKNIVSQLIWRTERFFDVTLPTVNILCYHSISYDGTIVDVTPEDFHAQLDFLKQNFSFITLDEVADYCKGKKNIMTPSVVLTFDDGYKDLISMVLPELQKRNITAAIYILSDPDNANRKEIHNQKPLLSMDEVRVLMNAGWTIGCHTASHADLTKLNLVGCQYEIADAKRKIEEEFDITVKHFAYPKGLYNNLSVAVCKKTGFQTAVTTDVGYIKPGIDPMKIPRICVDGTHTEEQFPALFSRFATFYFSLK